MKKIIVSGLFFASPLLALAQSKSRSLFDILNNIINPILAAAVPFLISIAVIYFLYGVIAYVMAAGDDDKKAKAKGTIIWGIVSIFVMVSVYGLVNLLSGTLNLDNSITQPPQVIVVPVIPR